MSDPSKAVGRVRPGYDEVRGSFGVAARGVAARGAAALAGLLLLGAAACDRSDDLRSDPPGFDQLDAARLLQADAEPEQWMTAGRDFRQTHHSPLAHIHTENVHRLGFAWEYVPPQRGRTPRGMEATPLVVDGVMYASGPWGAVYALDPGTGEEIWRYDPPVDGAYARRACCDVVNRGLEVREGRVYVGTLDGWLVALDAATGRVVWRADTFIDRTRSYTITSRPQLAGRLVVIGNSGAEFGVRGYISAYDARSGELAWRFFTVPGDPEEGYEHPELEWAAETWDPSSNWEAGGGGTVWGEMAYDPELDLLYVGTGNSSPYPGWLRSPSGGDNLFLASILAIRPETGRLAWHYQTTPGEIWDYTATQHMILADLEIGGEPRKALLQAPKNGFFYVLDRATGELLSAEPYVTVTWASHVDMEMGRPVLTGQGDYRDGPRLVFPSMPGGHNWQPMAYSPETGLVYFPAIDVPMLYRAHEEYAWRPDVMNTGVDGFLPPFSGELSRYAEGQPEATRWNERLVAWDPVAGREAWSVPLEVPYNGGALSTDGNLVFQGTASGQLVAYDARTGDVRAEIEVGTGIMAGPMTYAMDGEQHVAVMAGYGGASQPWYPEGSAGRTYRNYGRVLAFKLGGGPTPLPPARMARTAIPEPPGFDVPTERIRRGGELYGLHCARCHADLDPENVGGYPNLAFLGPETHAAFREIVLEGTLAYGGMASFADVLSEEDAEAVQAFIASRQRELREEQ